MQKQSISPFNPYEINKYILPCDMQLTVQDTNHKTGLQFVLKHLNWLLKSLEI